MVQRSTPPPKEVDCWVRLVYMFFVNLEAGSFLMAFFWSVGSVVFWVTSWKIPMLSPVDVTEVVDPVDFFHMFFCFLEFLG